MDSTRYLSTTTAPGFGSNRGFLGRGALASLVTSLRSVVLRRLVQQAALVHFGSLLFLAQLCEYTEVFEGRRVSFRLAAGRDVLEQPPHDLAASRLGQRIGETNRVRARELTDLCFDVDRKSV